MTTSTIHVSTETHALLHDLAHTAGVSMQEIVEDALELYRRQQILMAANNGYAALRSDPDGWQAYQQEQRTWIQFGGTNKPENARH